MRWPGWGMALNHCPDNSPDEELVEVRREIIRMLKRWHKYCVRDEAVPSCPQEPSSGKRVMIFALVILAVILLLLAFVGFLILTGLTPTYPH